MFDPLSRSAKVYLGGYAYGGLAEVSETDYLSYLMSGQLAEGILISSLKKHLSCDKIPFQICIDEYKRWFGALFSSSDFGVVLQIVYLLFTSVLEPEKEKLQAIVDEISERLSPEWHESLSPEKQESLSPDWPLIYAILRKNQKEINSGGSHIYKTKTVEDLSHVDVGKAWSYCTTCFKDPSDFRVVLVGKFDRVAGGIPGPSTPLKNFQRGNLTKAAFNFPQTVITKEVSMSRAEGMICPISFALCLQNGALEEERHLLNLLIHLLELKVKKVVGLCGVKVSRVFIEHFLPLGNTLLSGTTPGALSIYLYLNNIEEYQTVIDAVVAGIDKLVKKGPPQHQVRRMLDGIQWDKEDLGDAKRRVRESYNANIAKSTMRRILSYPRQAHTVVKLRY
ncbi:zinc protease PQQL-like [Lycium ferocissimum]|uniref:zinc protease PQQL-like n=1 Tax=Lycium ferocissimum TaxID=112874 RepID=UPI002815F787|nr:zinc protease PQQL-like [Lycium ferocissimum]